MATEIKEHLEANGRRVVFSGIGTGETCPPYQPGGKGFVLSAIAIAGTWGGATVKLRASIDGQTFFDMKDKYGDPLSFTENAATEIDLTFPHITFDATGGTGDNLTAQIFQRS